jgi:hypothetical protein
MPSFSKGNLVVWIDKNKLSTGQVLDARGRYYLKILADGDVRNSRMVGRFLCRHLTAEGVANLKAEKAHDEQRALMMLEVARATERIMALHQRILDPLMEEVKRTRAMLPPNDR